MPSKPLLRVLEDITLQYTYPRLDAEVSKHRNHLLKAPFCVHPATGRICVPIDPREVDSFDPEAVPTVGQLLRELGTLGEGGDAGERAQNQQSSTGMHGACFHDLFLSFIRLGAHFSEALRRHVRFTCERPNGRG